ncbi:hypothetical protein BFW01_g188 [Lasiodiplodia theobromae]|uniref:Fucose-specific lectin n=1 Tax=Lasiodiplodia theobromae TaxID=45133 RepID=A0A8H7MB41_9PEZI|nr:hypothetical protein BFW01_g188 [Lasiodiplodia theobromae]
MERHNDHHNHYSTLEVDQGAQLPEVNSHDLPQTKLDNTLPEAISKDVYPEVVQSKKRSAICGIRKKIFWIALCAIITAVAIAVGVGVGVGVGVNSDSSSASTSTSTEDAGNEGGSANGGNSTGSVAPFSQLAAENYTDKQGVERSLVYYQDSALDIWKADLDTSTGNWSLAKVNTFDMDPKNGTPIAAVNWVNESTVTDNSALVTYDKVCNDVCDVTALNIFRSAKSNETAFAYPNERPDFNTSSAALNVTADDDTAYALMPTVAIPELNETHPSIGVFLSAERKLREFYFARGYGWTPGTMGSDVPVDPGARIAAMWYTHDGLRYAQVLMTRSNGSVAMAYLDGGPENDWTYTDNVDGMEDVVPLSPISATKTGHLFALENGVNGTEIVHFRRTSVTGTPTFERAGPVSGHFKALIFLTPGPNTLYLVWDNSSYDSSHSATLCIPDVTYLPLLQTPPLHLAVLVAADSPLLMDCPPYKGAGITSAHAGLDAAVSKLRMAAYMWQAGTAEDMRGKGLGRRAFRLEEGEWGRGVDTVSSAFVNDAYELQDHHDHPSNFTAAGDGSGGGAGSCSPYGPTAKVHVVRTERTVAELRNSGNRMKLRDWFCEALVKHGGGPFAGPDTVVAGLVLDSHYSAAQDAVLANPPQGVEKNVASGIALAAFGSHTCWAWPRFVEEVASCLLDSTTTYSSTRNVVSTSSSAADADGSGAFEYGAAWQACAFGQALMLRGVGRAFGCCSVRPAGMDVVEDSRTYATQRNYASVFLPSISRRPGQHPLQLVDYGIRGNEEIWDLRDALALRCVPHFRIVGDPRAAVVARQARSGAPVLRACVRDGMFVLRMSVEWGAGGLARITVGGVEEEWPSVAQPVDVREWRVDRLERKFGREKPLELRAVAMNGKETVVANVWAFVARSAFVKVPGSDVVLQKRSVRSGELEARDGGERSDGRQYWEWAAMLKERGADGKLTQATSFDMRVGCILDGGVLSYADGHKTHLGPRIDSYGNEHHFGGHASEEIALTPDVDIVKVEIHRNSYELVGMRTTLADGTVRGELNENDRYGENAEIVALEPEVGEKIVGFFGRSDWKRSFNGIQEFGIITAPQGVGLPECVYDMPELKNTDGGLEETRSFFNPDGSRNDANDYIDEDADQEIDEEWDNDRD